MNQSNEPVSTLEQGQAQRNEEQLLAQAGSPEVEQRIEQAIVVDSVDIVDPSPELMLPEPRAERRKPAARYVVAHNAVDNWAVGETVTADELGDRRERLVALGAIVPAAD